MFVPTLTFWGLNALLLVVDSTDKPAFITRYRIQLDKNNPVCETQVLWSASWGLKVCVKVSVCESGVCVHCDMSVRDSDIVM